MVYISPTSYVNGEPEKDFNNPEPDLRSRSRLGLQILSGLKYDADDDGAIPSIAVGRPYSSSKAQPVFPEDESTGPYRIYFK